MTSRVLTDPETRQLTRILGASSRAMHLVRARMAALALQKSAPFFTDLEAVDPCHDLGNLDTFGNCYRR